jgi:hypothetical protein
VSHFTLYANFHCVARDFVENGGMETMISAVFRPEELSKARDAALAEVLDQQRVFARRANDPAARVAHAELERVITDLRESWRAAGLILTQAEGASGDAALPA